MTTQIMNQHIENKWQNNKTSSSKFGNKYFNIKNANLINHSQQIEQKLETTASMRILARDIIYQNVCHALNVPIEKVMHQQRGVAPIAHARQIAMYLFHTLLNASLTETGVIFHRDRTTVAHAAAKIEDDRDDTIFDQMMMQLEQVISMQFEKWLYHLNFDFSVTLSAQDHSLLESLITLYGENDNNSALFSLRSLQC